MADEVKLGNTTKTYNGNRDIPILSDLLKNTLLHNIKFNTDFLFTLPGGKFITPSTINSHTKRIAAHCGIMPCIKKIHRKGKIINLKSSDISTHVIRHTRITRLVESDMNLAVVRKIAGHKSLDITIGTYTSVSNQFKERDGEKLKVYLKEQNIM